MTGETSSGGASSGGASQARDDLARVGEIGASAALAARRSVRLLMLVTGVAVAVGMLGVTLVQHAIAADRTALRALLAGALCAALAGACVAVAGAQPVRAAHAGRTVRVSAWVTVALLAVTMAVGYEFPLASAVGAALTVAVWAIGAARLRG